MKRQGLSGFNTYIVTRYAAFLIASIASAMFNIFLFTALDPSWTVLLMALSISLECAKLTTVVSINVVKSLYLKLNHEPLRTKSKLLFVYYLVYGFLSICSSLGFSIYITAKTQAIRNSDLEILLSRQTAIEQKMREITSLQSSTSISNYMEYQPWIDANTEYSEYNRRYEEADLQDSQLRLARDQILDRNSLEYGTADQEYRSYNTYLNGLRSQRQRADQERLRIQNAFEASKNDMVGQLSILDAQLLTLIDQAGLNVSDSSTALIIIGEMIQKEELKIIEEKGMTYMFEGFSQLFQNKISADFVKIFILLLASILLEVTIYQCAPDVRINGLILKYFKRSLPEDMKFEDILEMYDDERMEVSSDEEIIQKRRKTQDGLLSVEKETPKDDSGIQKETIVEEIHTEEKLQPETIRTGNENSVIWNGTSDVMDTADKDQTEDPKMNSKLYRYGRSSGRVKDKMIEFISMISGQEPGVFVMDPSEAARNIGISEKLKDTFLDRLMTLKIAGKQLVSMDGLGRWMTSVPRKKIIEYSTEIVEG